MNANFFRLCVDQGVLKFGEFQLKSGRISPYFFNAGLFASGAAVAQLGRHYADAIVASGVHFDMLFGPAYKGIPLATTIAVALADHYDRDLSFAYNRKEAKDHGEGGVIVGAELRGRVLVVDDVISAGTSIGESVQLINAAGAELAGVAIALDRQERGDEGTQSAAQLVAERHAVEVISIGNLDQLIEFIHQQTVESDLNSIADLMVNYRARYGA